MLFQLLVPVEMLIANLLLIDRCSTRRYGKTVTYIVLVCSTIILFAGAIWLLGLFIEIGQGNGLFIFFGCLLFYPVLKLYELTPQKLVSIGCSAWVYTFLMFSLSVHTARLLPQEDTARNVFLLQTLLYLLTYVPFYRFVKRTFLLIVRNIPPKHGASLMWINLCWFAAIFALNNAMLYGDFISMRVVALLLLAVGIFLNYENIHQIVASAAQIRSLETLVYYDGLTQLRSRGVLTSDLNSLVTREIPFHLIYFDLNRFKTINDTYGHVVGDNYLYFFAQEVKKLLGEKGGFYRVGGDEFVCLFTDPDLEAFLKSVSSLPSRLPQSKVPFLGVSYGVSHFPRDARDTDGLMDIADKHMYEMKHPKPAAAGTSAEPPESADTQNRNAGGGYTSTGQQHGSPRFQAGAGVDAGEWLKRERPAVGELPRFSPSPDGAPLPRRQSPVDKTKPPGRGRPRASKRRVP
ncbi:MAG: GGDEF domain-containing protein [Oscillospiraceae bacterium]|jgi:diguanylate cyclase (GGDEF)-like protein|nr:GGDEF domain-containing protein [Oscillospiraceae bacterium]